MLIWPHCTLTSLPVIEDGLHCDFNMSLKKKVLGNKIVCTSSL